LHTCIHNISTIITLLHPSFNPVSPTGTDLSDRAYFAFLFSIFEKKRHFCSLLIFKMSYLNSMCGRIAALISLVQSKNPELLEEICCLVFHIS
jgi:hypothetical protein